MTTLGHKRTIFETDPSAENREPLAVVAALRLTGHLRLTILTGIVGVAGIAWIYLFVVAGQMAAPSADPATLMALRPWGVIDFVLTVLMWAVMMVAMMLPSAAPTLLMYATIARKMSPDLNREAATAAFATGYIAAWTGFSFGATFLQWGLEQLTLLSPMMKSSSYSLAGILLISAGVYQWTPIKENCLNHCQTPLQFLSQRWRTGTDGAFQLGLAHGLYCIGCCWVLMGLLFVGGVMNLLWVAAIAIFVLIEKVAPFGRATGHGVGLLLIGAGCYMLASGISV